MKRLSILFISAFLFFNNSYGQGSHTKRKDLVNSFIKTVYQKDIDAKQIMQAYMYFEPTAKYSLNEREHFLKLHLDSIKTVKRPVINQVTNTVIPYNDFHQKKVRFSKDLDNISILLNNGLPVWYFYFKEDKIFAFDYFTKDDEGYFITY